MIWFEILVLIGMVVIIIQLHDIWELLKKQAIKNRN